MHKQKQDTKMCEQWKCWKVKLWASKFQTHGHLWTDRLTLGIKCQISESIYRIIWSRQVQFFLKLSCPLVVWPVLEQLCSITALPRDFIVSVILMYRHHFYLLCVFSTINHIAVARWADLSRLFADKNSFWNNCVQSYWKRFCKRTWSKIHV